MEKPFIPALVVIPVIAFFAVDLDQCLSLQGLRADWISRLEPGASA
ncbi:hypothetical protein [Aromatoleum diolicum]|uniref:Uncharacterized protein n=1 Tax=Aromatoleum diolicum TaxID=75796 RepID=A0ABX1QH54_9RHOO|nr:hypothetical protein [Aromatoleum diolicum]NMG76360.1 hypothetical protein [Aromatoleum diolicum]